MKFTTKTGWQVAVAGVVASLAVAQLTTPVTAGDSAVVQSAAAPADRAALQRADRAAVEQAALDYLEGIYNADTARIERSVHTQLTKRGFWRDSATAPWGPQSTMTYEQLIALTKTWNADKKRDTTIKKVDVFEVLDQTATAKITAIWGVDYMHVAKYDGRWKIINIIWQAQPAK